MALVAAVRLPSGTTARQAYFCATICELWSTCILTCAPHRALVRLDGAQQLPLQLVTALVLHTSGCSLHTEASTDCRMHACAESCNAKRD